MALSNSEPTTTPRKPISPFKNRRFMIIAAVVAPLGVGLAVLFILLSSQPKVADPLIIALAAPLSGTQSGEGVKIVNTVQLYFDKINQAGGINGHPLKLVTYDDQGDADTARKRAADIVHSNALAVIGHSSSATSLAAAPVYKQGRLPAITASSTAPALTADNPYYFRSTFDRTLQSDALALYVRRILGWANASVILDVPAPDNLAQLQAGTAPSTGFEISFPRAGGTLQHYWYYDVKATADKKEAILDRIAQEMQADPHYGLVYLGVTPATEARDVIVGLHKRGVSPQYLGTSALGNEDFVKLFKDLDQERFQPGYYTEGMYAAAAVLLDSANDQAQTFVQDYYKAYAQRPDGRMVQNHDIAQLLTTALKQSGLTPHTHLDQNRQQLRNQLAAFNRPEVAFHGASGLLFFNQHNTVPQPVAVGQFVVGRFVSAPTQLTTVTNPALLNLEQEQNAGNILKFGQNYVWKQRVVYTGLSFNKISRIDQSKGTFTADVHLWFRYSGDKDVTRVEFPDLVDAKSFDANNPVESKTVNGVNYRLYRIQGDFKTSFDYRDYPFDLQQLNILLRHPRLTRDQVIYVIDMLSIGGQTSEVQVAFEGLSAWMLQDMRFFQDTLRSHATRGDPASFWTLTVTEYPAFRAVITIQRKVTVILIKTLLPTLLLVLIVYVTLHFPMTPPLPRLTIPTSALLAGAILLTGINSQLPEATYTTAVEYGFYVFFSLCLFCVCVGLIGERLQNAKRDKTLKRFNIISRLIYLGILAVTIGVYLLLFSQRIA